MHYNYCNVYKIKVIIMDCEICIYFDEHPFIREGDWTDYCDKRGKPLHEIDSLDKAFCEFFKEIEW